MARPHQHSQEGEQHRHTEHNPEDGHPLRWEWSVVIADDAEG